MPWTVSDVERFNRGLSEAKKRQWVRVANSVLQRCLRDGGSQSTCEASAIRQANGVVSRNEEHVHHYKNPLRNYEIEYREHQGQNYMVVPVIMMVEGVHSGSNGPLLHLAEELGRFVDAWNGIPISIEHPSDGEFHVSANQPHIIEQTVGRIYHSFMDEGRLRAEAWIDEAALQRISPEVFQYIIEGRPLDVSVGVFTDEEFQTGDWNGEHYEGIARNHRPDHLALLPGGVGACSWADGCGIRSHEQGGENVSNANVVGDNTLVWTTENQKPKPLSLEAYAKLTLKDGFVLSINSIGHLEIAQKIQGKLDRMDTDGKLHYLVEVFDNSFIYRIGRQGSFGEGEEFYQRTYTINEDETVEFTGEPVAVTKKVEYVAMKSTEGEEDMPKDVKTNKEPCCPEKVELLIQSELTSFTEDDSELLSTMDESIIDKMLEDINKVQTNINTMKADVERLKEEAEEKKTETVEEPQMNKEQALQVLKEQPMSQQEFLALTDPETREKLEHGFSAYEREREKLITNITENTNVFSAEELAGKPMNELEKLSQAIKPKTDFSLKNLAKPDDEKLLPPGMVQ